MTILRVLICLVAALATAASPALAGDAPAPAASAPAAVEMTKAARQEAERQRLIAKLRAEAPKKTEKPKGTVLDLPIFNRYNRP
jgi:hypothetical protein